MRSRRRLLGQESSINEELDFGAASRDLLILAEVWLHLLCWRLCADASDSALRRYILA